MTGLFFRVILELRIGNWRSTKATNSYIEATAFLLSTHEKIEHQNRDNKSMFLTSITITHLICDQRNSQWQIELSSGRIMLSQFYQPIYNHFLGGHGHLAHGIICQCMFRSRNNFSYQMFANFVCFCTSKHQISLILMSTWGSSESVICPSKTQL